MTHLLEMSQPLMARGDQLSDMQLGLLLANLQLDARITTHRSSSPKESAVSFPRGFTWDWQLSVDVLSERLTITSTSATRTAALLYGVEQQRGRRETSVKAVRPGADT
jgi:hypothetical protein